MCKNVWVAHWSVNHDVIVQGHEFFQECCLCNPSHLLLVMPLEQVVYLLGGHGQVLTVVILKEVVVVLERDEASLVPVHAPEAVPNVYLAQLVLPVQLKLVLQLQEVLEKLAKLHMSHGCDA